MGKLRIRGCEVNDATREMHIGALFLATAKLGPGELAVLVTIAHRLDMGMTQYGPLDPVRDPRNWRKEWAEENLDAAVYAACEVIRAEALQEEGNP